MSGDHGYDPFGFGEPNPAMEAAVAEIEELQGELARLRAENERLRERLGHILREATSHAEFFEKRGDVCWTHHWQVIMNIATLEAEP